MAGGGEPLYQRVKRELVAGIESGQYPPDVPFVTQRKICEQFGVSHATAVRALNDLVAEGYVTRRRGQGTFVAARTPATKDIACVLQFHSPHVSGLLAGIESVCDELGYRLYLNHCEGEPSREERALREALDHNVSGIIAYPAAGGTSYTEVLRRGVPLVLVDRYRPDLATDAVLADNFAAGRDLTNELIECGHTVIATLWDETDVTSVRDRLAGHVEALRSRGLPVRPDLTVLRPYRSMPAAERRSTLSRLLRGPRPPTVLMCANGYVLASAAEDLVALGFDIPGDVDLAGMDDAGPFDVLPLTLAAVSLPSREMGARAARLLHQRASAPAAPPERIVLPVTVTARRSSPGHLKVISNLTTGAHPLTTPDGPDQLLGPDGGLPEAQPPWPARDKLRVTAVRAVVTAPEGAPLIVVRVDTSEPGLYGLGCATFTQRYVAVAAAVDEYVGPLVIGRHPADIEDITRLIHYSSYWRNGPVLNNALSGLDQALWDIAGKRAGMPVYELLGGRSRAAVEVYTHAAGLTIGQTLDQASELIAEGYRHIRLQLGGPGLGTYGAPAVGAGYPRSPNPDGWDVGYYLAHTPALFAAARSQLGAEVSLMHDVHSRLTPKQAIALARALEPYRLSFLEDVIAPEYYDRLPEVRSASPVPIAVGEQIGSVPDAVRLIRDGGVDLLRLHTSSVGGLTPTRKLVALAELLGVRTAFHSPGDISPVGVAANLAVDVSTPAFGYQESHTYNEATREVFPGTPVVRDGYLWPSSSPGFGVDLDEKAASRFPPVKFRHDRWAAQVRRPDGALEPP